MKILKNYKLKSLFRKSSKNHQYVCMSNFDYSVAHKKGDIFFLTISVILQSKKHIPQATLQLSAHSKAQRASWPSLLLQVVHA